MLDNRSLNGLDSLENYAGILIIAWILFSPFAIFQALVSVRDSGYSGNSSSNSVYSITATEAVSPLLTLVGTICVVAVISVFLYRTPREVGLIIQVLISEAYFCCMLDCEHGRFSFFFLFFFFLL